MIQLGGLKEWGGLGGAALDTADVALAGIAYDGSAVYRKGAAGAPREIRRLSAVMPPVTESGTTLLELRLADLGDLDAGSDIESGWERIAGILAAVPPRALLTVLGGDHCSAIPVVAAQARRHPGLKVLWVDAHPDLCDTSRGGRWTCGCALRRALDVSGLDPADVVLAGCRDYDPEELDFAGTSGITLLPVGDLDAAPEAAAAVAAAALGEGPVHVSLDIDVLDPAYAPGTEIGSAGGLTTRQVLRFLGAVARQRRLVGLDIVEVSPPLDQSDITSLAALKIMFEFWGWAWKPRM